MAEKHSTRIVLCLIAIMVMSLGGCKSKSEPPVEVSDIDTLQGTWVSADPDAEEQWTFVISGTKIDVKGPVPEAYYSGTLKLNAEVEPKQADYVIDKCANEEYIGKTALTIYKIEGDKLTMVSSEPGSAVRPTLFDGGGDTRVFILAKQ